LVLVTPGWNAATLNYYTANQETLSTSGKNPLEQLSGLESGDMFILVANNHPSMIQQNDQVRAEISTIASFAGILHTAPTFITLEKYIIE
jgi:hypothetical protein